MKIKFSCGGSPIREIRSPFVDIDGSITVKVTGKENLQDYINSFKDSCNVEFLVSRAVNGDLDALNQRQAMYGDFTKMPKTYAEMLQFMINAQTYFDTLSSEQKASFDNDVSKFIASFDQEDFLEKAGFINNSEVVDDVVKEGVVDES